jgi:hypothetical protein
VEGKAEESADSSESEGDVEVETTTTTEVTVDSMPGESESPEDGEVEATSTTTPPPTTTSTTEPPAEEEIVEELELLEIIGLGTAQQASLGDRQLYFESYPEGLDRLKISVANAEGYCSVRDYQITYGLSSAPSDDIFRRVSQLSFLKSSQIVNLKIMDQSAWHGSMSMVVEVASLSIPSAQSLICTTSSAN